MFPFPAVPPYIDLTAVSYVTSSSPTNYDGSITMPSNIQAGDVIIVGQEYGANTNDRSLPGSGFTQISVLSRYSALNEYYYTSCVSYKIANGTEGGSSISGFGDKSAYNYTSAGVYIYRPNNPVMSITQVNKYTYEGSGDPASNILYGSTSTAVTIALAVTGSNFYPSITFSGATSDANVDINNYGSDLRMRAYGADKGAGINITTDMNDVGANLFTSVLLELS